MKSLNRNEKIGMYVSLVVVLIFFVLSPSLFSSPENSLSSRDSSMALGLEAIDAPSLEDLITEDVVLGAGDTLVGGERIVVHYVGQLLDGTTFDNSLDNGEPFTFTLGVGEVIAGWDQGLLGMKVGGVRALVIPPHLAYSDVKVGPIPANSTLLFQVMLIEIVR